MPINEYQAKWSQEDGEYVGVAKGFPSLSWLADTPAEALSGIKKLVEDTAND